MTLFGKVMLPTLHKMRAVCAVLGKHYLVCDLGYHHVVLEDFLGEIVYEECLSYRLITPKV